MSSPRGDVTEAERTMRRRRIVVRIVLFVTIIGLGLAVVSGTLGMKPGLLTHTDDPIMVGGSGPGGEVNSVIPSISGVNYANQPVSVPTGRPVVLLVVAHWCEYCKADLALMSQGHAAGTFRPKADIVIVSTRHLPFLSWPPSEALSLDSVPFPVIVDTDSSIATYLALRVTPTWYFIDRTGTIRKVVAGTLSLAEIDDEINAVTRE